MSMTREELEQELGTLPVLTGLEARSENKKLTWYLGLTDGTDLVLDTKAAQAFLKGAQLMADETATETAKKNRKHDDVRAALESSGTYELDVTGWDEKETKSARNGLFAVAYGMGYKGNGRSSVKKIKDGDKAVLLLAVHGEPVAKAEATAAAESN